MHIEVQVALNFVISYLYNKLPRRRVNLFGEELERALKYKFEGHWYPEKPFKGSAFRCLRVGEPIDPVIEQAAKDSGVEVSDIKENLPEELSVWIDPGEVSYRIGEKGTVKILYNEIAENPASEEGTADREVTRTFNPEAQCFKPIEAVAASLSRMGISSSGPSSTGSGSSSSGEPSSPPPPGFKPQGPVPAFLPKASAPVTFTTATFAQTKFGSTKLKSCGKKSHRLSPTEFSNYIKQRALQQQHQQQLHGPPNQMQTCVSPLFRCPSPTSQHQRPRSLSPKPSSQGPLDPFLIMAPPPFTPATFLAEPGKLPFPEGPYLSDSSKTFLEGIGLNSLPYSPQYQHLLMAN
uniref:Anti-proliferative protein domain-containing protein n=1 Tax=Strigamia maritima TaxID=126957 RepID=T1INI9_STRMM